MNATSHAECAAPLVAGPAANLPGGAVRRGTGVLEVVGRWLWRASYRGELQHLTDHQLRDMGLDRDAVHREAAKPFWRA